MKRRLLAYWPVLAWLAAGTAVICVVLRFDDRSFLSALGAATVIVGATVVSTIAGAIPDTGDGRVTASPLPLSSIPSGAPQRAACILCGTPAPRSLRSRVQCTSCGATLAKEPLWDALWTGVMIPVVIFGSAHAAGQVLPFVPGFSTFSLPAMAGTVGGLLLLGASLALGMGYAALPWLTRYELLETSRTWVSRPTAAQGRIPDRRPPNDTSIHPGGGG